METFSLLLAICAGNSPATSDAELWCFFDLRLNNGWVNNHVAAAAVAEEEE